VVKIFAAVDCIDDVVRCVGTDKFITPKAQYRSQTKDFNVEQYRFRIQQDIALQR
jgi:hypothetical protein